MVVVFDDLHWGEPTLFDLVEHVTDLSRLAPIFRLCVARPELMERRAGWGGGKLNATAVLLETLDEEQTDTLIEVLAGTGLHLSEELRDKVRHVAGGSPLFVEETLTLVAEAKTGDIEVPPNVYALLAARLDQLESKERRVLERGAVESQTFHLGAVPALSPTEPEVPSCLVGLVRKDLIRPDRPAVPGDDAFRFRHLLLRNAAYDGLAKSARADLHVRVARWLAEAAPDLVGSPRALARSHVVLAATLSGHVSASLDDHRLAALHEDARRAMQGSEEGPLGAGVCAPQGGSVSRYEW